PAFAPEPLDAPSGQRRRVRLADTAGRVRLLNVVNSLDTPVCDVETRRWDRALAELPADTQLYTISMDLPFAQARWCGAAGIQHRALSAYKDEAFGRAYGVLVKEWRLLQRAVFVIDRADRLAYVEYVPDQMPEPPYDAAMATVRALHERQSNPSRSP